MMNENSCADGVRGSPFANLLLMWLCMIGWVI